MSYLSWTFIIKIIATLLFWCVPLLFFPAELFEAAGLPAQSTYMFVRLLGWAYLALCVGYGFGLRDSMRGIRSPGPIWAGIVSNGGASLLLVFFGITGAWSSWSLLTQASLWVSALLTSAIALALIVFGVVSRERLRQRSHS